MSRSLNQEIEDFVVQNGGHKAKTALSLETGLSVHLFEKMISDKTHTPRPENAFEIRRALDKLRRGQGDPPEAA